MAAELDAVQRATIAIHIEQLEQKRQKLSQLDTEIADLIKKPEDLEEEILESEELQCTIAEKICRAKTFLETSQKQQLVEPTEQNTHQKTVYTMQATFVVMLRSFTSSLRNKPKIVMPMQICCFPF